MAPPHPHMGGCLAGPPFPVESLPGGGGPRGGAAGARGGGPTRPQGLVKRGVGGGLTGRPPLPAATVPPVATRVESPPSSLCAYCAPLPFVIPLASPFLGRGGYGFLAVDSSGAD